MWRLRSLHKRTGCRELRKVPALQMSPEDGDTWYIPHHGVYHPHKPGKIRVVFECSAKFVGLSLNSIFYKGPDLSNSLVGVLTRFREDRVAVMADIELVFLLGLRFQTATVRFCTSFGGTTETWPMKCKNIRCLFICLASNRLRHAQILPFNELQKTTRITSPPKC